MTWSPAPAPDRRPAVLRRALAEAAGMIAPVLADAAITSARRLLQRRSHRLLVASLLRRRWSLPPGNFHRHSGHREGRVPDTPIWRYVPAAHWPATGRDSSTRR